MAGRKLRLFIIYLFFSDRRPKFDRLHIRIGPILSDLPETGVV
jgi:hypothetical protein